MTLVERILADRDLADDVARALSISPLVAADPRAREGARSKLIANRPVGVERMVAGVPHAEAIVRRVGRPSLLISNGAMEVPPGNTWKARLWPVRARLERAITSVGRVEVERHPLPYIGSAWIIAPGVAITNRHVAEEFAWRSSSPGSGPGKRPRERFGLRISPSGEAFQPRVDFREEYGMSVPVEYQVIEVIYLAALDNKAPDLAFLRVEDSAGRPAPSPIPLSDDDPASGQLVAAIGYPAEDPRNSLADQARIFGGLFDVKRLAPGEVVERSSRKVFTHDCTTLGGNSGSVIVDLATGHAVGLHFAGAYLSANYAVPATTLKWYLDRAKGRPSPLPPPRLEHEPTRATNKAALDDRVGFDPSFLGVGPRRVRLPQLSASLQKHAVVVNPGRQGSGRFSLDYTHFSIAMHRARRMAIFTATNIDGAQSSRIKREDDRWALDPRVAKDLQWGNDLYSDNDLDRGHLTRRLDPAWGIQAEQAAQDTFFFTNCAPQHARFNQRLWVDLEDYLLDHADTLGFKATIFTGPIFGGQDLPYRGALLPRAFWKVAVMIHAQRNQLTATGYIVSQSDLLTQVEFTFGEFKTYQVPIANIENLTDIRFGLRRFDPLAETEGLPRLLSTAADLRV